MKNITRLSTLSLVMIISACGGNSEEVSEPALSEEVSGPALSGESLYNRCKACHTIGKDDRNIIGPNLYNIIGAKIAGDDSYDYSAALSAKEGVWDEAALDAFLRSPQGFASGTRMSFSGIPNADERKALIAYMAAQSE